MSDIPIDILRMFKENVSVSKDNSDIMEKALSNVLILLVQDYLSKTILPKRKIRDLSLIEDDIFFREKIEIYKKNLSNTKRMVKEEAELIKHIATGSENRKMRNFFKLLKSNRSELPI